VLGRFGFDVRIVEDVSRREMQNAIKGWRTAVQSIAGRRPALRQIAVVVREAELWLARFHLMRGGRLRQVRWHAISAGGWCRVAGLTGSPAATIHPRTSRGVEMRVRNSLRAAKVRDKNCRVVRRRGRVYVINKKNPRMKARQG
jgi:large subunit ribosomal protein L36